MINDLAWLYSNILSYDKYINIYMHKYIYRENRFILIWNAKLKTQKSFKMQLSNIFYEEKTHFSSSVFFLIHFIYGSYTIWKHFSFFAASSFLPVSYESAKACAVVVENDSSSSSSSQISTKNAITNLNSHNPQSRNSQTVDYGKQGSSSSSTYLSQVPDLSGKIRIHIQQ